MKKILFIEYVQEDGHINYNRIHIDALIHQGYEVSLVLHECTKKELPYPDSQYALIIPDCLKQRQKPGRTKALRNRIVFLLNLIYIRMKVEMRKYDEVVLSGFDELTLAMIPLCQNMHLTCHRNALSLYHAVKRFFILKLAKRNSFIVFNEEMKKPFTAFGINKVNIISHGCIAPYTKPLNTQMPISTDNFESVVFHPSVYPDQAFIEKIANHKRLQNLLSKYNTLLIVRNFDAKQIHSSNIQTINHYLSAEEYQLLFLTSDIILLAYPDNFQYRVSGVSYECVANQKKMVAKYLPALEYCQSFYNYSPLFNDIDQLCDLLQYLKEHPQAKCMATPQALTPDYNGIL